ncbi:MAG: nuclear transport factor 2 family protein [Kibdelosporangium sp.]
MSEYQSIAQRYIDSWNERDADKRREIIDELYTSDASFTDPLVTVTGPEAIDQVLAGGQRQFADLEFTLGPVDGHHDIARFTWFLGAPGAEEPIVAGFDVIVLSAGRIKHVHGFLDKVPAQ